MRGGDECYQIQPKIIRRERSGLQMHCGDGRRFVVRADEKLTTFVELQSAIRAAANCLD